MQLPLINQRMTGNEPEEAGFTLNQGKEKPDFEEKIRF
jgi:hypothetical protein